MAKVTAKLSNYRQSPRKVRLMADLVRGKNVADALSQLQFVAKRSSAPITKLIQSALANAENLSIDRATLFVKEIRVDKGTTLHRWMPRARGQAKPIHKRSSHILITLHTQEVSKKQSKAKAAGLSKAGQAK
jgi:large subunit ribosomal protein L22